MKKFVLKMALLTLASSFMFANEFPPSPTNEPTIPSPSSNTPSMSSSLASILKTKGTYSIDVIFYQTGQGAWDWTACLSNGDCYKLLGAESRTSFKYDLSSKVSKPTKPLSTGYFIAYETNGGADGLSWVFASKDAQFVAKLAGATDDLKSMNWDTTSVTGISYTISSDEKTIIFK